MFRIVTLGLAIAVAAPAVASKPQPTSTDVPADKARDKKFCVNQTVSGAETVTGSILSRRLCLTREQWEARGVTIRPK